MIDDQSGEQVVADTPAEEVPASESQQGVIDQSPTETQSPETETGENEVGNPPKENAAWAAMRAENKRLKEAVESVDPEYLEKLRGAVAPQKPVYQQFQPLPEDAEYTQVTKDLNWTKNQAALANQQISQLRQELELTQDRQAEDLYPELKTDKVFQQLVSEKKLAARILGHQRTTSEIAREVKNLLSRREEQVSVATAASTKQQMLEKQQAIAESRGQTTSGRSAQSNEVLRDRVRRGDSKAAEEVAKGLIADLEF